TDAAGNKSNPTGESIHTSFQAYDSLGTPVNVDVTAVLADKSNTGTTWQFYATSGDSNGASTVVGTGTLDFDSAGKLKGSTGNTINIDRTGTGAKSPMNVKLDFSNVTSLASNDSTLVMTNQDGSQIGTLNSF